MQAFIGTDNINSCTETASHKLLSLLQRGADMSGNGLVSARDQTPDSPLLLDARQGLPRLNDICSPKYLSHAAIKECLEWASR